MEPEYDSGKGFKGAAGISAGISRHEFDWCEWGVSVGQVRLAPAQASVAVAGQANPVAVSPLTIQRASFFVKTALPLDRFEPFFELGGGMYFLDGGLKQRPLNTIELGPTTVVGKFHHDRYGGMSTALGLDFFISESFSAGLRFGFDYIFMGGHIAGNAGKSQNRLTSAALRLGYSFGE